jgi:tRNA (guanine37-N1)-methyltransferase
MNNQKFYMTTAIAYASKKPHFGNTYEAIMTDALARYKREMGYDVFMCTGTDEHGQKIEDLAKEEQGLLLLCGDYEGIDERIIDLCIDEEVSIGDYVLTGGELAAAVMTDAIVRIIPGVIGDEQSALSDSFQDNLLEAPVYTRPREYKDWGSVPDILLSGHEAKIKEWELEQSLKRTMERRPDLLKPSTKKK